MRGPTLSAYLVEWLESYAPPAVGTRCFQNYRTHAKYFSRSLGDRHITSIGHAELLALRESLDRAELSPRTVSSYLGTFRLVLRDATIAGHVASNPFERPLPRRRTKRSLSASNKRVTFVPLLADELEALLYVLRDPQDSTETIYFPLTEFLVLTGLRWGEGVALDRDRVSWAGGLIVIDKAMERGSSESSPTKTGATCS